MTQCGKTQFGFDAWKKLITMANLEGDVEGGRALAVASQKKSCALNEADKMGEAKLRDPTIKLGYYKDAAKAFEAAEKIEKKSPDSPAADKAWIKAATLYKAALEKAPDHDEAPEAAMNGAFAYKQVGDYDKAIAMYTLFIDAYGSEKNLSRLQNGDPKAKPPVARNPDSYQKRVKFLKLAYDFLATSYILFFDYRKAAGTFETISRNDRFETKDRRSAARNAVVLYSNIGDRSKMQDARKTFFALNAPADQKAEVDWLMASAELKKWDERGLDRGANRAARLTAQGHMDRYYRSNISNSAANPYTVQAAYYAAKLRRAGSEARYKEWCKKTITAFGKFKNTAPTKDDRNTALGSLQADMAAECEYRELDKQIKREFDYASGKHRYKGVITDVTKEFKKDVEEKAKTWYKKLQNVITTYESRPWAVAARARQGSLYDSCRTGLYNARPPGLKMYTDKELKTLKKADKLCEEGLSDKACELGDTFRAKRRMKWRETRSKYLGDADRAMVAGYAEAILWARAWKVKVAAADQAIRRLAFFTKILGDAKLREYSSSLIDPSTKENFSYTDGYFLRMRRGMIKDDKPQVLPAPLPVMVQ